MNIIRQIGHYVSKALVFILCLPIVFYRTCITPYTPATCRFTPTTVEVNNYRKRYEKEFC